MKRYLFCGLLALPLLFLAIWSAVSRFVDSMALNQQVAMSGIDAFAFYYGIFPRGLDLNPFLFFSTFFSVLALPFIIAILLTSLFLSNRVLPLRYYSLLRRQSKWQWFRPSIVKIMGTQALFFLLFNLGLTALFVCLWGGDADSAYRQQYVDFHYAVLPAFLCLLLRQMLLMAALGGAQLYLAARFGNITATMAVLFWLLIHLFLSYNGMLTPFHLTLDEVLLTPGIWLGIYGGIAAALCGLVLGFLRFGIQGLEFIRNEVRL